MLQYCSYFRTGFIYLITCFILAGCSSTGSYTSLDLSRLPCEQGNSPKFFYPLELDNIGNIRYPSQILDIEEKVNISDKISDVIIFAHGWGSNAAKAESNYHNFICRLHGRLRDVRGENDLTDVIAIGLFWPSTISGDSQDAFLLQPYSYYKIRNRVDKIANGPIVQQLFGLFKKFNKSDDYSSPTNINLIGHSLGSRLLVGILKNLDEVDKFYELQTISGELKIILINAALSANGVKFIGSTMTNSSQVSFTREFIAQIFPDIGSDYNWVIKRHQSPIERAYFVNLHSYNDKANMYLLPIASIFNSDSVTCGAGACGFQGYYTLCTNSSGEISLENREIDGYLKYRNMITVGQLSNEVSEKYIDNSLYNRIFVDKTRYTENRESILHSVNIDTTPFVDSHTDIYKGRMANLLSSILYDYETSLVLRFASERVDAEEKPITKIYPECKTTATDGTPVKELN